MRIGIFVLAAGRSAGGPETYEVQLIRGLAEIDLTNRYFVYCASPEAAAAIGPLPDNFTFRVLRPSWRAVSVAITLPRWMSRDGVDFFHATYAPPPVPNRPFLFTVHCGSNFARPEFYPAFIRWRLNALHRVGLRRAGSILCVSDFAAGYVQQAFSVPRDRISTIYHGVRPEFFQSFGDETRRRVADEFGIDCPYVLHVGKLQARKNIVGLVHAYARYRNQSGSQAKLVFAGKKVETSEGIDEAIEELGLQHEVVQLGYVPHSSLPVLYAAARMTVFPSFYEGFGLPLLEAMAAGSPVITSNVTSLPEIAGDAALIVDPNSVEEIAQAMVRVETSPEIRAGLIERGLRRARQFTWEECARQTLEAYQRFFAGLKSRPRPQDGPHGAALV